jgi:hypothetical protein
MIFFTITNLLVLMGILFILINLIKGYQEYCNPTRYIKNNIKTIHDNYNKNFRVIQKYIDRYYITHIVYTVFGVICYLSNTVFIFIFLRYITLGEINILLKISLEHLAVDIILVFILKVICFLLCLYLYKRLIQLLFYLDVIKFHIYLQQYKWYLLLIENISLYTLEYMLNHFWILCYRIGTRTFNPDLFNEEMYIWYDQMIWSQEFSYSIKNSSIKEIAFWLIKLSYKYTIITQVFNLLVSPLKFLAWHCDNAFKLLKLTLYTFLALTLLYDFYCCKLHYIYYASFIFVLLHSIVSFLNFIYNTEITMTKPLMEYFYKNILPYKEQRFYILNYTNYSLNKTSEENKSLYYTFAFRVQALSILYNDLMKHKDNNISIIAQRTIHTYVRLHIIIAFIIVGSFFLMLNDFTINILLLTNKLPVYFTIIPLIIMLYCAPKIFWRNIEDKYTVNESDHWTYSRNHNIIFWIAAAIQGYILWLLILKPELIISNSEVILDSFLKITRIYTLEEKIMYLYNYFEYYITHTGLTIKEQEKLRYLLREINYSNIINETTTLKDIIKEVKMFIQTNYYATIVRVYEDLISQVEMYEMAKEKGKMSSNVQSWYTLLKNVLFIGALVTTLIYNREYYTKLWTVIKKLQDPYELYRTAGEIMFMDPYGRNFIWYRYTILEFFTKLKTKLPSIADIILLYGLEYIPLQVKLIFTGVTTALSGTLLLPKFISYLLPPLPTNKPIDTIYVTFLKNMLSVPIINCYNLYYFTILGMVILSVIFIIVYKNKKKRTYRK